MATLLLIGLVGVASALYMASSKPPAMPPMRAQAKFLDCDVERVIITRTETGVHVALSVVNSSKTPLYVFASDVAFLLQSPTLFTIQDASGVTWHLCSTTPGTDAPAESSQSPSVEAQPLPGGTTTQLEVDVPGFSLCRSGTSSPPSSGPSHAGPSPLGAAFTIRGSLATSYSDAGERVDFRPRGTGPCELIGFEAAPEAHN